MDDHGIVEMVLKADRRILLFRVAVGVALIAGASYWMFLQKPGQFPLFVAILVVTCGYAMLPLLRMLVTGVAVIITDQGLVDRTGGVDFVAWREIQDARIQSYVGLKLILLDLHDPEAVLGRLSLARRGLLRHYMKRYGGKPSLKGAYVQGGAEQLLHLIQERVAVFQRAKGCLTTA